VLKAFLLAGGRGERLRPLTLSAPKCLALIAGTPLLGIWLDRLARNGISDVLLNVSHHANQVEAFLAARSGAPRVELIVESAPRGTASTVITNRSFVADVSDFWIVYADNLTNLKMAPILEAHRRHAGLVTMGLFHAPEPTAAGIVTLAADGRVVSFEEKPQHPRSDLANAGVYLARQELFEWLPLRDGPVDFSLDVFPALLGRIYGYVIDDVLMDIGTPAALAQAQQLWPFSDDKHPNP
jgi:mannose-1-phosphate guanylyltransferase